ncbi:ABC transporter ATP-binding protein [Ktedonosporobacter rubrisoli]|uniref:ABC transporter ATP-binding protein n=1 Tax=Ktedonosporobacter rubrisoli TaxID=2509675 RepID=A0A4P6K5L4_KTERU|nr:ABC transporter ATP-binding protein [Ktedonosporobacter rubrisoli]QBD82836.1 ABC transporter ATP-binding protein [Ktedonosporobacter rubrisoli]
MTNNSTLLHPPTGSNEGLSGSVLVASLQDVYKRLGKVEALNGLSLNLFAGELLALLGPNGSGKTTTLSLLLGRRKPDKGTVRLYGLNPCLPLARQQIGSTPQDSLFPDTLKVTEVVNLVRAHFPSPLPTEEILQRFGLTSLENRQTGGLSGGQRRKLSLALAFAGNPRVVFLDEPTAGLDVEARHELWGVIRTYITSGGTVLLTTHYLEEVEALASRIAIIHRGRIINEGSVEAIKAHVGLKCLRLTTERQPELPGVVRSELKQGIYHLYTRDADASVRSLIQQNIDFSGLEVLPTSLEEAFLHMTGAVE